MDDQANSLSGSVAWITGAGGGMGEAIAMRLSGSGACLILNDLQSEKVERVAGDIASRGGKVSVLAGDLRDPDVARRTGSLITGQYGRLDVLVNCAGFNIARRRWSELQAEDAAAVIATNLTAMFNTVIVALPIMRARKSGTLVHISSTDGWRIGLTGGPAYSASKHGVVSLSHTLNLEEAANGIRSCVLCPGGADTDFLNQRATPPSAEKRALLLRPSDIADLVHYVVSAPAHVRFDQVIMTPIGGSSA